MFSLLNLLASADLTTKPITTILYSDGHMISKSFDIRFLNYRHLIDEQGNKENFLTFKTTGNDSRAINANVFLHENASNLSFAVETYKPKDGFAFYDYKPDNQLCREKTSENLRSLIQTCFANIALRELTQEEKQQLEKLKRQSKGRSDSLLLISLKSNY